MMFDCFRLGASQNNILLCAHIMSRLTKSSHWQTWSHVYCCSRLAIFVVLFLHGIVGREILKQRYLFRFIGNEYATMDILNSASNGSFTHSNNDVAVTAKFNESSHSVHIAKLFEREETKSVSSSKSASHLHALRSRHSARRPQNQSTVSFRQYGPMSLMLFVVLLAIWVASTVKRIGAFIDPDFLSYPLLLAVGSMGSLRGFWNGVVFSSLV